MRPDPAPGGSAGLSIAAEVTHRAQPLSLSLSTNINKYIYIYMYKAELKSTVVLHHDPF